MPRTVDRRVLSRTRLLITRLAATLAVLGLAGCASVRPEATLPDEPDLPAAWSHGSASALAPTPLADWWQRFDDHLLTRLVADALEANTDVRQAQAALSQARALRDVAAAGLQPTLDGTASAQRGRSGGDSTGSRYQLGLDAAWEIDLFGARRSALRTADATARASAAQLGDVQVSIAAEVALAYIGLRSAQARLAIAHSQLASRQQTLQITEWREQAGLLDSLQSRQARAATALAAAPLPTLQAGVTQAMHALAVLSGRPPAALATQLAEPAAVPRAADAPALGLPADILRRRADVRAAEQRVLAAQGRVDQADVAGLPAFRVGGSLGLSALSLGTLGDAVSVVRTVLAGVSLPLWDGGAARAQQSDRQAALAQARWAYRATVLGALKEVEDAVAALQGGRERVLRLQQADVAASGAATLARQRYDSGLTDYQTVLETQRSRFSAQDSLAAAQAEFSTDQVRLFKALGGGWSPDAAIAHSSATRTPQR